MSISNQHTTEAEGLAIFDDEREVRAEPAGFIGLQLAAVVLSYSFIIGVLVIAVVVVVLAVTLLWPLLLTMIVPWLVGLLNAG
jgi:hypothetical protein